MPKPKMVYVAPEIHRKLRMIAGRKGLPMGQVVADMVDREIEEIVNPWISPSGLALQQKVFEDVWKDPALDVYNDA